MKNFNVCSIIAIGFVAIAFDIGLAVHVYAEDHKQGGIELLQAYPRSGTETDGFAALYFSRWHDKQSKVEFICAQPSRWNNDAGVSCFLTGRQW